MTAAIVSEYRKFFSTRIWWILVLCMVAYMLMMSSGMGWVFGYAVAHPEAATNMGMPPGMGGSIQAATYGLGTSMGYVFPVIIAALAVTAEYRHNTIVPTFLGEPRRWVVMAAKVVAAVPMGFLVGVAVTATCLAGGAAGLGMGGTETLLSAGATWKNAALSVLACVMWSVVGVGLGLLVTSQVGVIVSVLAFTQLVEPLARMGLSMFTATAPVVKFFPGAASDAMTGGTSIYTMITPGAGTSLSVWQGAVVLAAYGVVFGLIGFFVRTRQDVS